MKRTLAILLSMVMLAAFSSCNPPEEKETTTKATEPSSTAAPNLISAKLYAVLSAAQTKEIQFTYTEGAVSAEVIANALTAETGLHFDVSASQTEKDILVVNWKNTSTLVAGLGETQPKEGFSFYDADSLNWFMMNSLCKSILENVDVQDVYYTMNDGEPLELKDMSPMLSISPAIAYNRLENSNVHVD